MVILGNLNGRARRDACDPRQAGTITVILTEGMVAFIPIVKPSTSGRALACYEIMEAIDE